MQGHHSEWLKLTSNEVLEKPHAGLILEIVAIQDIDEGSEIFIDYGSSWDAAWNEYVTSWNPKDVPNDFIPIELLNADLIVRTEQEQEDDPYPENVMIYCFLVKPNQGDSSNNEDDELNIHPWDLKEQTLDHLMRYLSNAKPCRILDRAYDEESDSMSYNIKADISDDNSIIMTGVHRKAIEFVYKPYKADQFISMSFRHDILIPDDIFPQEWRNLKVDKKLDDNNEISLEIDNNNTTNHKCRFYLAESSLPNAGIGIFTAVDLNIGDATQSDVVIHVHDYNDQMVLRCEFFGSGCDREWLIASYVRFGYLLFFLSETSSNI